MLAYVETVNERSQNYVTMALKMALAANQTARVLYQVISVQGELLLVLIYAMRYVETGLSQPQKNVKTTMEALLAGTAALVFAN